MHVRLRCCGDRFAANPEYILHGLDCIKINDIASSVCFVERKQFQSEINIGQLVNHDNVRRMISDDQIFSSFQSITGTIQYFHNMLVDVIAKIRQFGVYTFFLTCFVAEFYLKRNPITVARQINYVFKQLFGKGILSVMHCTGQILHFDNRRESQNRGNPCSSSYSRCPQN